MNKRNKYNKNISLKAKIKISEDKIPYFYNIDLILQNK